jgi:hypothetical protein
LFIRSTGYAVAHKELLDAVLYCFVEKGGAFMRHKRFALGLTLSLGFVLSICVHATAPKGYYGGGGLFVGHLRLKVDTLNTSLQAAGFAPFEGHVLTVGGGGAGGTLAWNMGGWGGGGTMKSITPTKEARLEVNLGGFSAQRATPVGSMLLSCGLLLGGGEAQLVLMHRATPSFDEAVGERYETRFQNKFFVLAPTVGLRVALTDFLLLNLEGSYVSTLGDWKFQGQSINGPPRIGGTMIRIGLEFGGITRENRDLRIDDYPAML